MALVGKAAVVLALRLARRVKAARVAVAAWRRNRCCAAPISQALSLSPLARADQRLVLAAPASGAATAQAAPTRPLAPMLLAMAAAAAWAARPRQRPTRAAAVVVRLVRALSVSIRATPLVGCPEALRTRKSKAAKVRPGKQAQTDITLSGAVLVAVALTAVRLVDRSMVVLVAAMAVLSRPPLLARHQMAPAVAHRPAIPSAPAALLALLAPVSLVAPARAATAQSAVRGAVAALAITLRPQATAVLAGFVVVVVAAVAAEPRSAAMVALGAMVVFMSSLGSRERRK